MASAILANLPLSLNEVADVASEIQTTLDYFCEHESVHEKYFKRDLSTIMA